MPSITIRINEQEKSFLEQFAKFNNQNISELIRQKLFDSIEDEYDITIAEQAYDEYIKAGKQSRPINELFSELNL
ncbi:MAG: hypothetical protein KGV46_02115 [Pasteurella sp.]|nr:hypothetical protein [Pasteurella sp.]